MNFSMGVVIPQVTPLDSEPEQNQIKRYEVAAPIAPDINPVLAREGMMPILEDISPPEYVEIVSEGFVPMEIEGKMQLVESYPAARRRTQPDITENDLLPGIGIGTALFLLLGL